MKRIHLWSEDERITLWSHTMAKEFETSVAKIVSDTDFVSEIAEAIACTVWLNENESSFIERNNLTEQHCVCYLNSKYSGYEKEVEEAFDDMESDNQWNNYFGEEIEVYEN